MSEPSQSESDRSRAEPREFARRGPYFLSTDAALIDVAAIHAFLSEQSYWAPGIPREVVEKSIKNSLCFGLFCESRQIGFARLVTDRATFAWLADVFVIDAYRGQGLGKWMVRKPAQASRPARTAANSPGNARCARPVLTIRIHASRRSKPLPRDAPAELVPHKPEAGFLTTSTGRSISTVSPGWTLKTMVPA